MMSVQNQANNHQPYEHNVHHIGMARYNPYEGLPPEPPAVRFQHVPQPNFLVQPEFPPLDPGLTRPDDTYNLPTFYQEPNPMKYIQEQERQQIKETKQPIASPRREHQTNVPKSDDKDDNDEEEEEETEEDEEEEEDNSQSNKRKPQRRKEHVRFEDENAVHILDGEKPRDRRDVSSQDKDGKKRKERKEKSPRSDEDDKKRRQKDRRNKDRRNKEDKDGEVERSEYSPQRENFEQEPLSKSSPRQRPAKIEANKSAKPRKHRKKDAEDDDRSQTSSHTSSPRRKYDEDGNDDDDDDTTTYDDRSRSSSQTSSPRRRHKDEDEDDDDDDDDFYESEGSSLLTPKSKDSYSNSSDFVSEDETPPTSSRKDKEKKGYREKDGPRDREAERRNKRDGGRDGVEKEREEDDSYFDDFEEESDPDSPRHPVNKLQSIKEDEENGVANGRGDQGQGRLSPLPPQPDDQIGIMRKRPQRPSDTHKHDRSIDSTPRQHSQGQSDDEKINNGTPRRQQQQDLYADIKKEMLKSFIDLNKNTAKSMPQRVENLTDEQLLMLYEFHRKRLLYQRRQEAMVKAKFVINETYLGEEIQRLKKQQMNMKKESLLNKAFPLTATDDDKSRLER